MTAILDAGVCACFKGAVEGKALGHAVVSALKGGLVWLGLEFVWRERDGINEMWWFSLLGKRREEFVA